MMSHSSFDSGAGVKWTFLILGTMAGQGRPIEWAAHHRKHHAFSDRKAIRTARWTDSYTRTSAGFCAAPRRSRERYCKRLLGTRSSCSSIEPRSSGSCSGLAIPLAIAGWSGLLWGGFVRMAFFSQVAYSVNSFGHAFGSRAFETTDESRNNWILAVLAFGDGWHNNHHAFPSMAFHGMRRRQIDLSGFVIRVLAALGLVWNVKRPNPRLERGAEPPPRREAGLMVETATRTGSASVEGTRAFLQDLFADYPRDFAVRFWDGTVWEPDAGKEARFTVVLRHPGAVRAMFSPPGELTVSEAYVYDDFDVEGDLEAVFPLADHLLAREAGLAERLRGLRRLLALPSGRNVAGRPAARQVQRPALLARARPAGDRLPLRRFERVLRPLARLEMAYSCAVFESPDR